MMRVKNDIVEFVKADTKPYRSFISYFCDEPQSTHFSKESSDYLSFLDQRMNSTMQFIRNQNGLVISQLKEMQPGFELDVDPLRKKEIEEVKGDIFQRDNLGDQYAGVKGWFSLYYDYLWMCTGMGHEVLSLPESYHGMTTFIHQASSILNSLLTTDAEEFEAKRRKKNYNVVEGLIDELKMCCKQWNEADDEDTKQSLFHTIYQLQTQVILKLSTECSSAYLEKQNENHEISPEANAYRYPSQCILRNPFSKLLQSIQLATPAQVLQTNVDNWYITIIASIQQYYVFAIYEIVLYLYMFAQVYQFGTLIMKGMILRYSRVI